MNSDTIVELIIGVDVESNSIGEAVYKDKTKKIFATKKAVRQSEFFQAAAVGFKPEIVLEVNNFEYANEEYCILEGQKFKIYRAYPISKTEKTELYLTAVVGDTNVTS